MANAARQYVPYTQDSDTVTFTKTIQQKTAADAGAAGTAIKVGSVAGLVDTYLVRETIDLTALADTSVDTTFTLPAGAVIKSAHIDIDTTVVAGGTTVKVGVGVSAGDLDAYLITADLVAGTTAEALFNTTALAAEVQPAVSGLVTAGTSAGDTNISAGSVTVAFTYDIPVAL